MVRVMFVLSDLFSSHTIFHCFHLQKDICGHQLCLSCVNKYWDKPCPTCGSNEPTSYETDEKMMEIVKNHIGLSNEYQLIFDYVMPISLIIFTSLLHAADLFDQLSLSVELGCSIIFFACQAAIVNLKFDWEKRARYWKMQYLFDDLFKAFRNFISSFMNCFIFYAIMMNVYWGDGNIYEPSTLLLLFWWYELKIKEDAHFLFGKKKVSKTQMKIFTHLTLMVLIYSGDGTYFFVRYETWIKKIFTFLWILEWFSFYKHAMWEIMVLFAILRANNFVRCISF